MVSIVKSKIPFPEDAEPAWDIARLFPAQGFWDEDDYLSLDTNRLVELTDGIIEVLPMPTPAHQRILLYLCDSLRAAVRPKKLGETLIAPMPVRLRSGKFREPDVMLMLAEHSSRKTPKFWEGADLVMEIVSEDAESHERDYTKKRADYADAGVAEYWIVDPVEHKITVLTLHRGEYIAHGEFRPGQSATSIILPDFALSASAVFEAANDA
jgi:Uma2 family endonuclease